MTLAGGGLSRGEALAISLVVLAALFTFLTTIAATWINRRMAVRDRVNSRLTALETKLDLMDVGGTQANRALIVELRRDFEVAREMHRRDVDALDDRIGSLALSTATIAERLNAYTRGRRPDGSSGRQLPSG